MLISLRRTIWISVLLFSASIETSHAQCPPGDSQRDPVTGECIGTGQLPNATNNPAARGNQLAIPIKIDPPRGRKIQLDTFSLYKVEVSCQFDGLQELPIFQNRGLFFDRLDNATHAIAITKNPHGKEKFIEGVNTDIRALFYVYAVTGDRNNREVHRNTRTCVQPFYISGRETLYLLTSYTEAKNFSTSGLLTFLDGALKVVSPLLSVFLGSPVAAVRQAALKPYGEAISPLADMAKEFNNGTQYVIPAEAITEGNTKILTPYSAVTISVTKITSIVKTEPTSSDLVKQLLANAQTKGEAILGKDDIAAKKKECGAYMRELQATGFGIDDIAYMLGYAAVIGNTEKREMIECIGRQHARLAIAANYWSTFEALRYSETDVDNVFRGAEFESVQPVYVDRDFNNMLRALGTYLQSYSKSPPLLISPGIEKLLSNYFADTIEFQNDDPSLDPELGGTYSRLDFVKFLAAKGRIYVGCGLKDTSSYNVEGTAPAVFLAFTKITGDGKVSVSDAVLFFAWTKGSKIHLLRATNDIPLIEAVLESMKKYKGCQKHEPKPEG